MYLTIAVILFIITSLIVLCKIRSDNMKSENNQIDTFDAIEFIMAVAVMCFAWGVILPVWLTFHLVDCFIHNKDVRDIFGEDD